MSEQTPGTTGDRLEAGSRLLMAALCVLALVWAGAASSIAGRAAHGLGTVLRLAPADTGRVEGLLAALFLLFLYVLGVVALDFVATRGRLRGDVLTLPRRSTRLAEWATGAAVGWGVCLVATVPLVLLGDLHGRLSWPSGTLAGVLSALATLAVLSLAEEAIFRGYAFRRLSAVLGDSAAAVAMSLLFAAVLVARSGLPWTAGGFVGEFVLGLLLTMAYLRTHALWAGWGLHFAYRAVMAVLLGLPIVGDQSMSSPALLHTSSSRWLTGGSFGPDAGLLALAGLVGAMAVLYRATREFAWAYTHRPIVGAGYAVTVAPPAAHAAMERTAPPPLVQILPTMPPPPPPPGR